MERSVLRRKCSAKSDAIADREAELTQSGIRQPVQLVGCKSLGMKGRRVLIEARLMQKCEHAVHIAFRGKFEDADRPDGNSYFAMVSSSMTQIDSLTDAPIIGGGTTDPVQYW